MTTCLRISEIEVSFYKISDTPRREAPIAACLFYFREFLEIFSNIFKFVFTNRKNCAIMNLPNKLNISETG